MKKEPTFSELASYLKMPGPIMSLVGFCQKDLYFGPLYFDKDGDECIWGDEGAKQFDFVGAVEKIADWYEDVDHELYWSLETEEILTPKELEETPIQEFVSSIDVKTVLFGKELKPYVQ